MALYLNTIGADAIFMTHGARNISTPMSFQAINRNDISVDIILKSNLRNLKYLIDQF